MVRSAPGPIRTGDLQVRSRPRTIQTAKDLRPLFRFVPQPGTNTSASTMSVDGRLNETFTGAGLGVIAGSEFEVGGRTQGTPARPTGILGGNLGTTPRPLMA